jgi:hypothetical protein
MCMVLIFSTLITGCSDEDKSTSSNDQPHGIQYVSRYDTPNRAMGVIIEGNYAYVADHDSGMHIINIANPTRPVFAGRYQCPGAIQIDIKDSIAYVADERLYSLEIVDISNPNQPELLGRFDTLEVLGVKISGDNAILGCGNDGLQVVNISDPVDPFLIGSCEEVQVLRFELVDNYALVPGKNGFEGLFSVSLAIPSNPVANSGVNTGGIPFEVAVKNEYAYMTNIGSFSLTDTGYLYIIDITDIVSPKIVDSIFLGNATIADFIAGNNLYVTFMNSDTTSGFQVIDISNPVTIEIVAAQTAGAVLWDIWVEGSYIYVAADTAGLLIYRFNP